MREVLTQEVLTADREAAEAAGDERGAARARAQMRELALLPAGFVIERTRADGVLPPSDPGCSMLLFDERFRPRQLAGRVDRRMVGRQMLSWTGGAFVDVLTADAMIAVLTLASSDAER